MSLGRFGVLDQEPAGSALDRAIDVVVEVERGQDDDPDVAQQRVATICRVASSPSMTGIRTSISTTSGRSARASLTASAPSLASATASMSSSPSRIDR
jgi:hypothetical protein